MASPSLSSRAVLSLGSNLPPRGHWLNLAFEVFREEGVEVVAASPRWNTTAIGSPPQPDFLNQVVLVEAVRRGRAWLELAVTVERRAGRRRAVPKGPRTLDVDVIMIEGETWCSPELTVPHPALLHRPYLLRGVAQLVPGWVLPGESRSITELARDLLSGSWAGPGPASPGALEG